LFFSLDEGGGKTITKLVASIIGREKNSPVAVGGFPLTKLFPQNIVKDTHQAVYLSSKINLIKCISDTLPLKLN
jgi:hypothetical protein